MGDFLFQSAGYPDFCAKKGEVDGLDAEFCQSLVICDPGKYHRLRGINWIS